MLPYTGPGIFPGIPQLPPDASLTRDQVGTDLQLPPQGINRSLGRSFKGHAFHCPQSGKALLQEAWPWVALSKSCWGQEGDKQGRPTWTSSWGTRG